MSLEELRKKIDEADAKIVKLIAERIRIAEEIGREKKKQGKQIEALSEAILKVADKVDAGGGGKSEGGAFARVLETILGGGKGGGLGDVAKTAEGLVKVAEAMDRFRNPPRMSYAEALLMKAGMRAALPRYMTKAELRKYERQLIAWEGLGEEGETEHLERTE